MDPFDIHSLLILLPLGSFFAGLAATPHCALMCGPLFVLFGAGGPAYQIGRVGGYIATGAAAGLLGASLNFAGDFAAIQHLSLYFMAATFILFGAARLMPARIRAKIFPDFTALTRWLVNRMNRLTRRPSQDVAPTGVRSTEDTSPEGVSSNGSRSASVSLVAGTLSALLPCGPLIPLWLLAAGSGNAIAGGALSGGFVLGTIPGAALIAWGGQRLGRTAALHSVWFAKARRFAGVALLIAGVAMLGARSSIIISPGGEDAAEPICHTPPTLFL
ncbi:MAG: sulfite exporter TauE/SafE family protein [bacterium]|nr:sulfite exporter TauE/SafE family protein [bacterium]